MNPRLAAAVLVCAMAGVLGCPSTSRPLTVVGGACVASDEGLASCEDDTSQLIACEGGAYALVSDCHGPKGCAFESTDAGLEVSCDTSGNSLGDHCANEGGNYCDPDAGHQILHCLDGGLISVYVCPQNTHCQLDAGLLSCY